MWTKCTFNGSGPALLFIGPMPAIEFCSIMVPINVKANIAIIGIEGVELFIQRIAIQQR